MQRACPREVIGSDAAWKTPDGIGERCGIVRGEARSESVGLDELRGGPLCETHDRDAHREIASMRVPESLR